MRSVPANLTSFSFLFLTGLVFAIPNAQAAIQRADLLSKVPLRFEKNLGQAKERAPYVARGVGYQLAIEATENRLIWTDAKSGAAAMLKTKLVGANRDAKIEALEPMAAHTSYFIGHSQENWHPDVPNFSKIRVDRVYPGIDLVFYGNGGTLEYDFLVAAGANPASIQFDISGAERVKVDPKGDLVLATSAGDIRWKKPVLYQRRAGIRSEIDGRFSVRGHRVRFEVGAYDRARALVIDPALFFLTYFGAPNQSGYEGTNSVGTDAAGNVYVTGLTGSQNLPTTPGVAQPGFGGGSAGYLSGDTFVVKFNPSGSVLYVTYLGGSGDDYVIGMYVDSAGNAYLTGYTTSSDFPIFPKNTAAQTTYGGAGGNSCQQTGDAFVTKLNPNGTQILYSTYFGGSLDDEARGITVDAAGNAYIAGGTRSTNLLIVGGFQTTNHGAGGEPGKPACGGGPQFDPGDAFVAKLNSTGTQVLYSTYLGGSQDDIALAIGLDGSGNIYVAGATLSTNFPTTSGVLQTTFGGVGDGNDNPFMHTGDGFITKIPASGGAPLASTYLGKQGISMRGEDAIATMVVNSDGTVWVGGSTSSVAFPVTATAVQKSLGGYLPDQTPFLIENNYGDGFVAKIDQNLANILYATFLGGSGNDGVLGIAVSASGLVYVAGITDSPDFPVITGDAAQGTWGGDNNSDPSQLDFLPTGDGFFVVIDPTSATPVYGTFMGGSVDDYLGGVALDGSGNVWMTGGTRSSDIATTQNAPQRTYTGGQLTGGVQGRAMIAGFRASGAGTVTTTLAHVADGNGFRTQVLLVNTGTVAANYTLQFFDQNGIPVSYGLGSGQSMSGTIQPGAEVIVQTQGQGRSTNLGWGQLTAPTTVKGMLIYQQQASPTSLQEGSAPIQAASSSFVFPFDNTNGTVTSIGFANPNTSQSAMVNFTICYEPSGLCDPVQSVPLNALQQNAQVLTAISANTAGQKGLVQVSSSKPVALVAFRFQGAAFTLFDTLPTGSTSSSSVTSTIAHAADGNNFRTTVILTNSSTAAQAYSLRFLNAQGQTQTYGLDATSSLTGTVKGGTTTTINTTGLGSTTNLGWAQLTAPQSVSGIAVFRQTNPGQNEQQATIPILQTILSHFFLPFDNVGNTTSIALANPDPVTTATINVTFRFNDGTSSTGQTTLTARNYLAQTLAQLFPQVAGKAGVAEFTSNTGIAVVEVRFNPTQAFTSLRAIAP